MQKPTRVPQFATTRVVTRTTILLSHTYRSFQEYKLRGRFSLFKHRQGAQCFDWLELLQSLRASYEMVPTKLLNLNTAHICSERLSSNFGERYGGNVYYTTLARRRVLNPECAVITESDYRVCDRTVSGAYNCLHVSI